MITLQNATNEFLMSLNTIFNKHIAIYHLIENEETEAMEAPMITRGVRHFPQG